MWSTPRPSTQRCLCGHTHTLVSRHAIHKQPVWTKHEHVFWDLLLPPNHSTLALVTIIAVVWLSWCNKNSIVVQWEGRNSFSDTTCAEGCRFIAVLTAVQPAVHCSAQFTWGKKENKEEVWNASTSTHSTSAALLCREMKWKWLQGYIEQEWASWGHQISCWDLKVVGLQSAANWAAWLRLGAGSGSWRKR